MYQTNSVKYHWVCGLNSNGGGGRGGGGLVCWRCTGLSDFSDHKTPGENVTWESLESKYLCQDVQKDLEAAVNSWLSFNWLFYNGCTKSIIFLTILFCYNTENALEHLFIMANQRYFAALSEHTSHTHTSDEDHRWIPFILSLSFSLSVSLHGSHAHCGQILMKVRCMTWAALGCAVRAGRQCRQCHRRDPVPACLADFPLCRTKRASFQFQPQSATAYSQIKSLSVFKRAKCIRGQVALLPLRQRLQTRQFP